MIRVWDVEQGTCIHQLTGHLSLTSGMQLRGNILVSGNADSTVKIWNIDSGKCLHTLAGEKMIYLESFFDCLFCFLGRNKHASAVTWVQVVLNYVVSSGDDGTVKLWDLETGDFIRNLVTLESTGNGGKIYKQSSIFYLYAVCFILYV
jgi:F-box/WD-40 domain protein 7